MNVLVDALNIAYRAHYVHDVQHGLTSPSGKHTGTVYGFFNILSRWMKQYPEHDFVVVWDSYGGKEARQEMFEGYKSSRQSSAPPDMDPAELEDPFDFSFQLGYIQALLRSLEVKQAACPGREADDVLAFMVRNDLKEDQNIILTSDRDMLQLVTRKTLVQTPDGKKIYDVDKVVEEYGVRPEKLLQYRALCGDKSDELPGLSRFRKKVVARLVNEFGDIDNLYAQDVKNLNLTKKEAAKFVEFKEQALVNLKVMSFMEDCPIDYTLGSRDDHQLQHALEQLGITTLTSKLLSLHEPAIKQGTLRFSNVHHSD